MVRTWVGTFPWTGPEMFSQTKNRSKIAKRIHADVIVYIFAHLHTPLRTEENLLGIYWLQTAKKLVKRNTWLEC